MLARHSIKIMGIREMFDLGRDKCTWEEVWLGLELDIKVENFEWE